MGPEAFKKALEALSADLVARVEARRVARENDDGQYWHDLVERTFRPYVTGEQQASGPPMENNFAINPDMVDGPELQDETKEIFFWGKARNLVEVLQSSDMMTHMDKLAEAHQKSEPAADIKTEIKDWQATGKAKLRMLAASPYKGGFLADAMGLGKTLTALMAAFEVHRDMKPACGPVLVVCLPSCIHQWADEIAKHFRIRPKVLKLEKPTTSATEVLAYDIVLCTNPYLRQRYKDLVEFEDSCAGGTALLPSNPDLPNRARNLKRLVTPLYSQLFDSPHNEFSVLIVDEVHDARNPDSLLNAAICRLRYKTAFLLTGTLFYNFHEDLPALLRLLPRANPFRDLAHYRHLFGTPDKNGKISVNERSTLSEDRREYLLRLLKSMTIARPASLLKLKNPIVHPVKVKFRQCSLTPFTIEYYVRRGLQYLQQARRAGRGSLGHIKGLALLRKAQALSASPLLLDRPRQDGPSSAKSQPDMIKFKNELNTSVAQYMRENNKGTGKPDFETVREFFTSLMRRKRNKPASGAKPQGQRASSGTPKKAKKTVNEGSDYEPSSSDEDYDDDADEDDDYCYEDSDDDASGGNIQGQPSSLFQTLGLGKKGASKGKGKSKSKGSWRYNTGMTAIWLGYLQTQSDRDLMAPRVRVIVNQIAEIRKKFPDEKIVVASSLVKFLDVVKVALERKDPSLNIMEYNGTVDARTRSHRILDFNGSHSNHHVLLLSANSGGAGLNIASASHMILAEPFWAPGLRAQVIGRVRRLGQAREVHVYDVYAPGSRIDEVMRNATLEKDKLIRSYESLVVSTDDQNFFVPELGQWVDPQSLVEIDQNIVGAADLTSEEWAAKSCWAGKNIELEMSDGDDLWSSLTSLSSDLDD